MSGLMGGARRKDPDERKDNRPQRQVETLKVIPANEQFEAPGFLGPDGVTEFDRIVDQLRQNKLLSAMDISYIAGVAKDWEIFVGCEKLMKHGGISSRFEETDKGNRILAPESIESRRALEAYKKGVLYLGVTPAARQKIRGEKKEEADEVGKFMQKYGS